MRNIAMKCTLGAFMGLGVTLHVIGHAQEPLDRTMLPIAEPKRPVFTELDVRDVKMPPPFQIKAPAMPRTS